ncbi:omptin family outer membrane protease [Acerihabitans sp. KWT182]|uniref:Omptin family outer membrane protease n=1 Tax=Acerihabitans sp. KWT182 TaxID=3157919 RepID=A0AAU7QF21_9GAMM
MLEKNISAIIIVFATTTPALAEENIRLDTQRVKASASMGWLSGEAKEYVFDARDGYKVSELTWQLKNSPIVKGDIAWDATDIITLNIKGWTTLASSGAGMEDYDWLNRGQSRWTHQSVHPNTRLSHANEIDVNIKGWLLNDPAYRLGALFGYQQTRFSWSAHGGSYHYDNGKVIGEIPRGAHVIGYRQKYAMPYLGLAGMYRYQNIEFNALLKFSQWVMAKDNDEHYRRNLTFRHQSGGSNYYSAAVDAGYYLTPNAKVFAELAMNKYEENKGSYHKTDNISGKDTYFSGNSSGLKNAYYTVSAGVQYLF